MQHPIQETRFLFTLVKILAAAVLAAGSAGCEVDAQGTAGNVAWRYRTGDELAPPPTNAPVSITF